MPRVRTARRLRSHVRRRSRLLLPAVAVLVAVGVAVFLVARPGPDNPRAGSTELASGSVHIEDRLPRSYRIAYRVEIFSGKEKTTTTSELFVHRPFESRAGDSVEAFTRHAERGSSFFIPPGPTITDRRPDAVLHDAVRDGYADKRELRRVTGRTCRVFRTGAGSTSPSLPPLERVRELTDVCVDEAGLILEEVTYGKGKIIRRSVATSVSEHPRVSDDTFRVPKPKGDPRQVGSVLELEPDSRLPGGTFWELPKSPKGFTFRGRYSVVPAGQPGFTDPLSRGNVITFVSEVWTDGADVLVIEQGATQGSEPFGPDRNARDVKAGKLGRGELRYSMSASEVRFLTGGTRFVTVRGTLAPSKLLAIARSLRGRPEGPLRVKR
jgi:hypothetical protein